MIRDSQFMTVVDKRRVLRAWERFLSSGLKWERFTRALYHHLTLYCGFIAHYDRAGFFCVYFKSGDGKAAFLSQFDLRNAESCGIPRGVESGDMWWCDGDYEDINREMISIATNYIPSLLEEAAKQQRDSDLVVGCALLARHGIKVDIK